MLTIFFLQVLKLTKLREVTRNDLFPSADMVVSMSREFGVPLTAEDFGGKIIINYHWEPLLPNAPGRSNLCGEKASPGAEGVGAMSKRRWPLKRRPFLPKKGNKLCK